MHTRLYVFAISQHLYWVQGNPILTLTEFGLPHHLFSVFLYVKYLVFMLQTNVSETGLSWPFTVLIKKTIFSFLSNFHPLRMCKPSDDFLYHLEKSALTLKNDHAYFFETL